MHTFFEEVYRIVEQIPYAKVVTYGQIAHALGRPNAAREVGWAMRHCPEHLPWQRVVKAGGVIAGGESAQVRRQILEDEGVGFLLNGNVDMKAYQHDL